MSRPSLPRPGPAGLTAHAGLVTIALLVHVLLVPGPATAGPTVGFVENFSVAGVAGWDSQATNSNPGTGGIGGAGDGYLHIARTEFAAQLGSRNTGVDYAGDYLAAGVNQIRFSLSDVGANQNLEIHFAIGNSDNFWLHTLGFIPPENAWAEFTVDLADTTQFVVIRDLSGGSYSQALAQADRVHLRHEVAPFDQSADAILGEFGMDGFKIESVNVGVGPARPGGARPVMLAPPFPNPAQGRTTFSFETFEASAVTIAIVDARGRIVRRESIAAGAAGRHAWTWDGRDGEGRLAAAGVYRVRAYGPGGGTSRPLVLID